MTASKPLLFTPLKIRDITFPNRIMVSPMAQYSSIDGIINDWHFTHYSKFALGGAGLIFTEATKIERRGLGTVGDMGLWKDEQIFELKKLTYLIHQLGSLAAIQLNHAGRKAGTYKPWDGFGPLDRSCLVDGESHWEVIGPSATEYLEGWPIPRAMTQLDINTVIENWVSAAIRANKANFDVLEIHGAHGYLIHQFLSPAANHRKDAYGGDLINRMRFALEVTEAVRNVWPQQKPLFFRISAVDEGGWTIEDSIKLCHELKLLGVDLIDCSASGISIRSPTASRNTATLGFQVAYANTIKQQVNIPTAAVGLIVDAKQAENILGKGEADLVAIGRELLYNPFWAIHAAQELGCDEDFELMPIQYGWWLSRREKTGYSSLEKIIKPNI
jgi:hypothetical protein